ncbi:MAG: PAS domain-containing protein, partial [Wenzhouxiangellaceae bacterium]
MNDPFTILLDEAPDAVFCTRRDGSFTYVNRTAWQRLGYSREELLAKRIFEIDPDLDAQWWKEHWDEMDRQRSAVLKRRHRHKSGELIPVEVNVRHLHSAGEHVHFSFVRDLRQQQRLEEERQTRAHYFEALFFNSPLMQFIVDPEVMAIVDANLSARKFYGYPELRGMPINQINASSPETLQDMLHRARTARRNFFDT